MPTSSKRPASSKRILTLTALSLGLLLSGCGQDTEPADTDDPGEVERDPRQVTSLDPNMEDVVGGNNAFAMDLYASLSVDDGNIFLSPFSVSAALAMTWAGAATETAREMAEVMHIRLQAADFHESFGLLMRDLGGDHPGRGYTLAVGNRIWGQEGYGWAEDFKAVNEEDYGAPMAEVDIFSDPEGVRQDINAWVAEQTRDKIPELLLPGEVNEDTRMVLTNAIYFKADWVTQFDPEETREISFLTQDESLVDVPVMFMEAEVEVAFLEDLSVLRLPYQDDEVSMLVLLPKSSDGLNDLEARLTPENIQGWVDSLTEREIPVYLPRWEMRYRLDMAETLERMGMITAVDQGMADFSAMTDSPNDLFIARVIHEAYVKVDEEGTEAAAATAVEMEDTAFPGEFRATHPFVYLIRDDLTGSVLFMGRVADPS